MLPVGGVQNSRVVDIFASPKISSADSKVGSRILQVVQKVIQSFPFIICGQIGDGVCNGHLFFFFQNNYIAGYNISMLLFTA